MKLLKMLHKVNISKDILNFTFNDQSQHKLGAPLSYLESYPLTNLSTNLSRHGVHGLAFGLLSTWLVATLELRKR